MTCAVFSFQDYLSYKMEAQQSLNKEKVFVHIITTSAKLQKYLSYFFFCLLSSVLLFGLLALLCEVKYLWQDIVVVL